MHLLERAGFLAHRDGERLDSHRAAREFVNQRFDHPLVHFVEPIRVDVAHGQRGIRHLARHAPLRAHLREVAHPAQMVVRDARSPARPPGNLERAARIARHPEQARAAQHDALQFLRRIIIEPRVHPEARAQRRAEHARARGRADQREARQIQSNRPRVGPAVDDDVELVVLHRGIEVFFDRGLQPVDFVDEQHVAPLERCEQAGEVTRLLDHRAAGAFDVHAHRVGDDVGEGGLAEARRAGKENMLERVASLGGGGHEELDAFSHLGLAGKFTEGRRAQGDIERRVGRISEIRVGGRNVHAAI